MSLERILEDSLEVINGEDRIRDLEGRLSGSIDDVDDVELEIRAGTLVAIVDGGQRLEIARDVDEDDRSPIEIPPETEPPGGAPKYLVEGLQKQSPETLLDLAKYARGLSEQKTREAKREIEDSEELDEDEVPEEWDVDEWEETLEDADAPSGATITTKTIDGRGYFYYQWREGDKIKSEYISPVSPSSGGD